MRVRVLMIGPGEAVDGGIAALVRTVLPALQRQVDLCYLETVQRRPLSKSGRISLENLALVVSQYIRLLLSLARFKPRVVHVHTSQGIGWLKDSVLVIMAKACRRSVVLHMHGGNFCELYTKSRGLAQVYTRRVLSLADAVIAVSAEQMGGLASIVPAGRVFTLRNCIDVDALACDAPDRSTSGPKALFMGVVGPSKGAFDILNAMDRLKSSGCSLQFWMAGAEEREGDLARARLLLHQLNLEDVCHLPGMVRGARKSQLLREASLFALPSYHEGLPMAILEAMAAGLPIVTTGVGGIPEVVKDGYNGFLVKPGDVATLADRLATLANDQPLRQIMGRRSREIAEQELDVKPYVQRLVTLYESLAGV